MPHRSNSESKASSSQGASGGIHRGVLLFLYAYSLKKDVEGSSTFPKPLHLSYLRPSKMQLRPLPLRLSLPLRPLQPPHPLTPALTPLLIKNRLLAKNRRPFPLSLRHIIPARQSAVSDNPIVPIRHAVGFPLPAHGEVVGGVEVLAQEVERVGGFLGFEVTDVEGEEGVVEKGF